MKINPRAFPMPVVGNGDDVNAGFQATYAVTNDRVDFTISIELVCSSASLLRLIEEDKAAYVMHVDCSTTMFRRAFTLPTDKSTIKISGRDIDKVVEITSFIVAKADIPDFRVENANPDFAGASFDVSAGDILAYDDTFRLHADLAFDQLKSVSAIINIKGSDDDRRPAEVGLSGDKVIVRLCRDDFRNYLAMKIAPDQRELIVTLLVVPALMEAVFSYKAKSPEEREMHRWCRILRSRFEELDIENLSAFEIAQWLLELPLERAFRRVDELAK